MLKINGKVFMNLQEAVQWLLDNNALPFQSSANYIANTEIGLGTIVNPSPAKVRIGSLIFFADSKVSTVIGLTENGFICSDKYNNLVDDVVYVSNVALNSSGHLIVTLSNGTNIDAGLIKQVTSFEISVAQHLIANYNDGTFTDLGAIFSGNVNISGNIEATGNITGSAFIGYTNMLFIRDNSDRIRFVEDAGAPMSLAGFNSNYCRWSLSGTHLMAVLAGTIATGTTVNDGAILATFSFPSWIGGKISPVYASDGIEIRPIELYGDDYTKESTPFQVFFQKSGNSLKFVQAGGNITTTKERHFRIQFDLLIDAQ